MPAQKRIAKVAAQSSRAEAFWKNIYKFRGRLDIADYKNVVLSLMFLRADSTVPWRKIADAAHSQSVFSIIDEAIKLALGIEYRTATIDLAILGELIQSIETLEPKNPVVPDVFEYCIEKFAQLEVKAGASYCSPNWLVNLLVRLAAPTHGTLLDPCCGSGGLLSHASVFARKADGDLQIYGQESNLSTWRICKMNLKVRGISCSLGPGQADAFQNDLHPILKADFVLANPPFNLDHWNPAGSARQDWPFGVPPDNNANFAWIQHIIRHLAPNGTAAFSMSNGALSSKTSGEGDIRRDIVNADLVDCIIGLPSRLFQSTRVPASIWILAPKSGMDSESRERNQQCLFINAQNMGRMVDRVHSALNQEELDLIVQTYRAWRGAAGIQYKNVAGFCQAGTLAEIRANNYLLTPSRYIRAEAAAVQDVPPAEKLAGLAKQLDIQFRESIRLEQLIRMHLDQVVNGN